MIYVCDDAILAKKQEEIEYMLTDAFFPWFFNRNVLNYSDIHWNDDIKDIQQSVMPFLSHRLKSKTEEIVSTHFDYFVDSLIAPLSVISGMDVDKIFSAQINLTTTQPNFTGTTVPHIDRDDKHYVVVYYVNDSDGETILYKSLDNPRNKQCVLPKRGRFLVFDGSYFHSWNPPKLNSHRIVVNFNISVKE